MPVPFSGGCACGAVRYTCTAEPYVSYLCHCTECQKRTGSAFGISVQVPAEGVTIEQGTLVSRTRIADSGNELTMRFLRRLRHVVVRRQRRAPSCHRGLRGYARRSVLGAHHGQHLDRQRAAVGPNEARRRGLRKGTGFCGILRVENLTVQFHAHDCRDSAQAARTATSIVPIPSISQCMTSPGTTGPTPSGVPVMITSPG